MSPRRRSHWHPGGRPAPCCRRRPSCRTGSGSRRRGCAMRNSEVEGRLGLIRGLRRLRRRLEFFGGVSNGKPQILAVVDDGGDRALDVSKDLAVPGDRGTAGRIADAGGLQVRVDVFGRLADLVDREAFADGARSDVVQRIGGLLHPVAEVPHRVAAVADGRAVLRDHLQRQCTPRRRHHRRRAVLGSVHHHQPSFPSVTSVAFASSASSCCHASLVLCTRSSSVWRCSRSVSRLSSHASSNR